MTGPHGLEEQPAAHFLLVAGRSALLSFVMLALSIFVLGSAMSLIGASEAKAQSARHSYRPVKRGQSRKRMVVRKRYRMVKKTQKTFFGGLFAPKRKGRSFRRVKPLFGGFSGLVNVTGHSSSQQGVVAKRLRAAARRDALSARSRRKTSARGWGRGAYRTMCVRMCDGYYFPVSFKARSRNFKADEGRCRSSCSGAQTKLFFYSNPGGSVENMRALDGGRYKDIANAFRYRKEFIADCRCKAEPWTEQAKEQHTSWALAEKEQNKEPGVEVLKPEVEINTAKAQPVDAGLSSLRY